MPLLEFLAWVGGIVGVPAIGFYWLRGMRRREERRAAEELAHAARLRAEQDAARFALEAGQAIDAAQATRAEARDGVRRMGPS